MGIDVRHDHEILLELDADPLQHSTGTLKLTARKLEAGAPVKRATLEFEYTEHRGFSVDLPDDAGGFRVRLYRDGRPPAGGGYGSSSPFRSSLTDYETLKLHSERLKQPDSLEISEDEKGGFNLPHR